MKLCTALRLVSMITLVLVISGLGDWGFFDWQYWLVLIGVNGLCLWSFVEGAA